MVIYDISQTLDKKTAVWPGDQKFRHRWSMQIAKGHSCNVSAITMSAHTGTHLDAPYHFDETGPDIGGLQLLPFLGPARVFEVPPELDLISAEFLVRLDWKGVERALFRTRASRLVEDRFDRDFTSLDEGGAEFLAGLELLLVGTDTPSIDAFLSKDMSCHKILCRQGIAILEGARLADVPPGDYELICLPLKFRGLDGSPVRAVLRRPG
jgi:arylformamidase